DKIKPLLHSHKPHHLIDLGSFPAWVGRRNTGLLRDTAGSQRTYDGGPERFDSQLIKVGAGPLSAAQISGQVKG
ncbi:MAG TPA: hypothetical protein VLL57_07235, partial [Candidatus Binataceae bacterium]|nr:hypothetical protein [Candidatus Binataceae bacterium]